jgi:hypothetical protein
MDVPKHYILKWIEDLVVKECNNNYIYTPDRKDGPYTAIQVYEAFKNDPFWYVHLEGDNEIVSFRERKEYEYYKKNREVTMLLFVKCVLRKKWKFDAPIYVYGGFARSAMMAWNACKTSIYAFMICFQKLFGPKDISKKIGGLILDGWFDDFSWFRDEIEDIDLLIRHTAPCTYYFDNEVQCIRDKLNKLHGYCKCIHYYEPKYHKCMTVDKTINLNCHKAGVSSHSDGEFLNQIIYFNSPAYEGEKVNHYGSTVKLDITTMIDKDNSDFDVNNLILFYDSGRYKFKQRKELSFPEGNHLTLKQIEENISIKQFRSIPLDYKQFKTYSKYHKSYIKQKSRASDLESRGWVQNSKYPAIDTTWGRTQTKDAKEYFKSLGVLL